MGSWALNIVGHGIHDNKLEGDVDRLAKELVARLRKEGHTIEHASLTIGSGRVLHELVPAGAPKDRLF